MISQLLLCETGPNLINELLRTNHTMSIELESPDRNLESYIHNERRHDSIHEALNLSINNGVNDLSDNVLC